MVITGMPFATWNDPKVRLKREYLDEQAKLKKAGPKALLGEEWYNQEASRAVNQAIGRVIRHRHDYGAIIFCDERFLTPNRQSQISLWMQPHIRCYTKFGDTIFTLTRFFRDGVCGPTKLELTLHEDQENINKLKSPQPVDKFCPDKQFRPVITQLGCSIDTGSSKQKQQNNFCHLAEVVPANRSSLTSNKLVHDMALKQSSTALSMGKKLIIPGAKSTQLSNLKTMNLSRHVSSDENSGLMASCSLKKPKLLITGQTGYGERSLDIATVNKNVHTDDLTVSLENGKPLWSGDECQRNARGRKRLLDSRMSEQNSSSLLIEQKDKVAESGSDNEEKKGSDFLIQVREKLTDVEYKEFVSFMKALKSKTMKISQVLQSIAGLFSLPNRLHLLQRFKDYIPAKYHSLYEQYVLENQRTVRL